MSLATAFIITLTTKIALAAFAALQPQNTSLTWIFGFWLPISAMFIYITFGHFKTKKSSLDERLNYGDSCYYLGFLFTIASIILSLYIIGVSNEEFNAADFQDLELVIGYFMGHRFYINDTLLEIDPSEYNGGRQTLKITQVK